MGNIESPIGKRTFSSSSGGNHFTIPDESQRQPEPDTSGPSGRQLYEAQQARQNAQPQRMSADEAMSLRRQRIAEMTQPNANEKKRIELLVGIGRATEEVPVEFGGTTTIFYIRTLKSKERKHVARHRDLLAKTISTESLINIRTTSLAYSIYAVDGIELDYLLGSEGVSEEERYMIREEYVDEMDDTLANYLFERFEDLTANNVSALRVNSPEDAKGVADALKKSSAGT